MYVCSIREKGGIDMDLCLCQDLYRYALLTPLRDLLFVLLLCEQAAGGVVCNIIYLRSGLASVDHVANRAVPGYQQPTCLYAEPRAHSRCIVAALSQSN